MGRLKFNYCLICKQILNLKAYVKTNNIEGLEGDKGDGELRKFN
jgi:hypothetical protein